MATLNLGKLFTLLLIEKEQLRISKYGVEKPGYEIRYLFSTIELINFQNFQRLRLRCKYFTEGMYTKLFEGEEIFEAHKVLKCSFLLLKI